MLAVAYGKPCAICGQPMTADQKLDLDHTISVMLAVSATASFTHDATEEDPPDN